MVYCLDLPTKHQSSIEGNGSLQHTIVFGGLAQKLSQGKRKIVACFQRTYMLTVVAAKFGKDSEQYQKAGGTKNQDAKKLRKK